LRPHVKTHKTREIVQMQLDAGITKHKCATIAEAEMLADTGAPDILLAYPPVGPNCERVARLTKAFPTCRFSVLVDHAVSARALSDAMARAGTMVTVLMDVDVGQHRTGIAPGANALALYELLNQLPGIKAGGLHIYDGHNHQASLEERAKAVRDLL